VQIDPACRLLFIGLWCFADREGRFEDRPIKIKMAIFPAEDYDIPKMLSALTKAGFLCHYEVDGVKYFEINNFTKHQRPHPNEAASELPPRSEASITLVESASNQGAYQYALNEERGKRKEERGDSLALSQAKSAEGFDEFWSAYPKKRSKGQAEKAWQKIKPDASTFRRIIEAIEIHKRSNDWQKESGAYIPYPATWLNAKCWEDEINLDKGTPWEGAL
jgi:hypothetical protein